MKTDIMTPQPQVSTLSGELSLLAPDPARIFPTDIVTALRHENRYGGHSNEPVSVLQHSITVWLISFMEGCTVEQQRVALWHDAPEAYIKDLPRPLKKLLGPVYAQIEGTITVAVAEALSVPIDEPHLWLKDYDNRALAAECRLYRPPEAFADWVSLLPFNDGDLCAAEVARKISRLPNNLILLLDAELRAGRMSGVQRFVAQTFGDEWQHGAWKEVQA
jgi:hypothetical protein